MAQLSSMLQLTLVVILVAITTGRRSSKDKWQPSSVSGYKGGPSISINDKQNIMVKDDDDDEYNISVEKSYKDENDLDELTNGKKGHSKVKVQGEDEEEDPYSQEKLMGMMVALTERVTSLQHTLTNIKLQNHYIYRTMKKGYKSCQSPNDVVIQTAAQKMEKPVCPSGYTENANTRTCYKFATERISWRMARERCRVEDTDLVSIETKAEQRWITEMARRSPDTRHCDFWTGATDKNNEGDWRWISTDNALSFSAWNHNEPNNGRGDEHCMQMLWVFNWSWNDAKCNYINACYICETPLKKVLRV